MRNPGNTERLQFQADKLPYVLTSYAPAPEWLDQVLIMVLKLGPHLRKVQG